MLPVEFEEDNGTTAGARSVSWRIRAQGLNKPGSCQVSLETLAGGVATRLFSAQMPLPGLRAWVEEGAVVLAGLAGDTVALEGLAVRVLPAATLLMVR
jgi:hypothetical protein